MDSEIKLGPREQQISDLLVQGYGHKQIADALNMKYRTVKNHLGKMFLKFGVKSGNKRVKLAVLLYRRERCNEAEKPPDYEKKSEIDTEVVLQMLGNAKSLNSSPKASSTGTLRRPSEQPKTLSKIISESSLTSSDSGIESNLRFGTKSIGLSERLNGWC